MKTLNIILIVGIIMISLILISIFSRQNNVTAIKEVSALLFYSESCTHCKAVLSEINNIRDVKLCNLNDPTCLEEFNDRNFLGVPVMIVNNKDILTGEKEILDFIRNYNVAICPINENKTIYCKTNSCKEIIG